jgi:hypothetical protein
MSMNNFPQIDNSGTPDIPNLNISTEGLIKLLKAVNPNKASSTVDIFRLGISGVPLLIYSGWVYLVFHC